MFSIHISSWKVKQKSFLFLIKPVRKIQFQYRSIILRIFWTMPFYVLPYYCLANPTGYDYAPPPFRPSLTLIACGNYGAPWRRMTQKKSLRGLFKYWQETWHHHPASKDLSSSGSLQKCFITIQSAKICHYRARPDNLLNGHISSSAPHHPLEQTLKNQNFPL